MNTDIMGLLYNQNNVATEASPITTLMEEFVGQQLCLMLGYVIANPMINPAGPVSSSLGGRTPLPPAGADAWGHITCVSPRTKTPARRDRDLMITGRICCQS